MKHKYKQLGQWFLNLHTAPLFISLFIIFALISLGCLKFFSIWGIIVATLLASLASILAFFYKTIRVNQANKILSLISTAFAFPNIWVWLSLGTFLLLKFSFKEKTSIRNKYSFSEFLETMEYVSPFYSQKAFVMFLPTFFLSSVLYISKHLFLPSLALSALVLWCVLSHIERSKKNS